MKALGSLGFALAAFACSIGFAGEEPATNEARTLVATVLDEPIYLDQLTPPEASHNRKEFPAAEFETWLHDARVQGLTSRITARIFAQYVVREKLRPTDAEIDELLADVVREHAQAAELDAAARERLRMQEFWARASSRDWRTAKALFEKYGGRVAVSSFGGYLSVEGRQASLRASEKAGQITFADDDLEAGFWKEVASDRPLDATLSPENSKALFVTTPWDHWRAVLAGERSDSTKSDPETKVAPDVSPEPAKSAATPAVPSK